MKIWRGFKRFWHDQITTPNGDVDGSRVGLLIVLVGAAFFIFLAWEAYVKKGQSFDPSGYGDGLIKIGAALLAAAAGVRVKGPSETPYNPEIAAANFPDDPGAQAAVAAGAGEAQAMVDSLSSLSQDEITQANSVLSRVRVFWTAIKSFFTGRKPGGK